MSRLYNQCLDGQIITNQISCNTSLLHKLSFVKVNFLKNPFPFILKMTCTFFVVKLWTCSFSSRFDVSIWIIEMHQEDMWLIYTSATK